MSRPPTLELPEGARAYRLATARGDFAVLDAGTAVLGTALLVPGFTGSKEDFIALLEPLALAGYRVVAVDGRGQHETGGPPEESAYTQAELAADVLAQTEALGGSGPVHVLGHSLGGLIVRAAAIDAAPPWTSLTIMSSGPAAIDAEQQARTRMLVEALPAMGMEAVWQAMRDMDAENADAPDVPPAIAEFLYRRWMGNVPEQLIATGKQLIAEPDRVAELAAVPIRTLVLSGDVDYAWPPEWLDEMALRLGARRVVIKGAEHSPNVDQPEATAEALIDFWSPKGE
ncbi:alpha/beta hydrolase [Streptomyces sp. So13.3]|uniref:alpha/beta fold hydrolase n=1 Tax=unclassified Streptomyces TaxID=2593676 RepID=UPI0011075B5A|nr:MULTISPECIES: alpha/beta fold hydrolase [unclassified Streptomyces]MCZ4098118.1 alpha/beta fold hydrolase [Streptomyces sp. H39-C1]NEA73444.1 alpha/beta hydrolase [Streptomyces sp. SID13588]QNA75157.1 alpha/beta hydrolase [Streptomyces sp. So13.3]